MHVSLTDRLEKEVKNEVASGFYNNASEFVREALRHLLKHQAAEREKLEQLRKAVALGAEQLERGEVSHKTVSEIVAEAKKEKYG